MAKTMKAALVRQFKKPLLIDEVPVPEVGQGQILVKIEACGVCHTDLHAADGDWPVKPNPPFIPGHEGVGTVAAVGAGVTAVREGDRVGVPWLYTACGHCKHCLGGWETLCDSAKEHGLFGQWGLCRIRTGGPKLCRPFARRPRLGCSCPDPLCRSNSLQGAEGNRYQAR